MFPIGVEEIDDFFQTGNEDTISFLQLNYNDLGMPLICHCRLDIFKSGIFMKMNRCMPIVPKMRYNLYLT